MNPTSNQNKELSYDQLSQIDTICNEFEEQWKSGNKPKISLALNKSIELDGVDQNFRSILLQELVSLDIDYRRDRGENPSSDDYLAFSDDIAPINEALRRGRDNYTPPDHLKLVSEYDITEFHARGGLGQIYLAKDKDLNRIVAIKFPRDNDNSSASIARLNQEAKITSRMKHPGIVPVLGAADADSSMPCYAMQLIEGKTLKEVTGQFYRDQGANPRKFETLQFRKLLRSLVSVCNTVAYAHQQNIIHRDIKPANIMVGQFGETYLLDWGIAKSFDCSRHEPSNREVHGTCDQSVENTLENTGKALTETGQVIGTLDYASPEQLQGDSSRQGPACDIYSLGATLFFLLTGRAIRDPNELLDNSSNTHTHSIVEARSQDGTVPVDLNAICNKALQFLPAQRYANVRCMLNDLELHLADKPVSVVRQNLWSNATRWFRHHTGLATSLLLLLSVVAILIGIGAWIVRGKNIELAYANRNLRSTNEQLLATKNKSMSALRTVTGNLMQEFLGRENWLTHQDRDLLDEVLKEYKSLANQIENLDHSRQIELEATFRIAQIQNLLGHNDSSRRTLEQVIPKLIGVEKELSNNAASITAGIHSLYGKVMVQHGSHQLGIDHQNLAVQSFRKLAERNAEEDFYRQSYAKSLNQLGISFLQTGNTKTAAVRFSDAKRVAKSNLDRNPDAPHLLTLLADVSSNLGMSYSGQGKYKNAASELENAIGIHEKISALGADKFNIPMQRCKTYLAYANTLSKQKKSELARQYFERTVKEANHLIEAYPKIAENRITNAKALIGLGKLDLRLPEKMYGVEYYEQAVEMANAAVNRSKVPQHYLLTLFQARMDLALSLRLNKLHEQAIETYQEMIELGEKLRKQSSSVKIQLSQARGLFSFAMVYKDIGQHSDAIKRLKQAEFIMEHVLPENLLTQPTVSNLLKNIFTQLAWAHLREENHKAAIKFWDRLIEISTGDMRYVKSLRALSLASDRPLEAAVEIESLIPECHNDGESLLILSSAMFVVAKSEMDTDTENSVHKEPTVKAKELFEKAIIIGALEHASVVKKIKTDKIYAGIQNDVRAMEILDSIE